MLNKLTKRPTRKAEIMVPMPRPTKLPKPKNIKDREQAIQASVVSKAIFTVPKRQRPVPAMALTNPSPGTMSTLGATSMQMPKAKIMQPTRSDKILAGSHAGSSHDKKNMKMSIKALNTMLTAICRN